MNPMVSPYLASLLGMEQTNNLQAMQQMPAAPQQQGGGLGALMGQLGGGNALLGAGLGMMGASQDRNINPWQSALQGMTTMQAMKNRSEMVNMQKDRYALEKAQMENELARKKAMGQMAEKYKASLLRQFQSPDSDGGITLSPAEEAKLQAADLAIASGDNSTLMDLLRPQKPLSTAGKLASDLSAGLITQEQYATENAIRSRPLVQMGDQNKPIGSDAPLWFDENGKNPLPGTTPAEASAQGFRPVTQGELKDRRDTFKTLSRVRKSYDNYRSLLKSEGTKLTPSGARTVLKGAFRDLQLELKELYNLGVLNGPDLTLMDQILTDPTSLVANLQDATGMVSKDALIQAIDQNIGAKLNAAGETAKQTFRGFQFEPIALERRGDIPPVEGAVMVEDAAGNRAWQLPDGTYQEI